MSRCGRVLYVCMCSFFVDIDRVSQLTNKMPSVVGEKKWCFPCLFVCVRVSTRSFW